MIGLHHALASRRVYTDGAELIFHYASSSDDEALLTVCAPARSISLT